MSQEGSQEGSQGGSQATNQESARAVQISPHVWAIPLTFHLPLPGRPPVGRLVHAYLVRGTREAALVDCGTAGSAEHVLAAVTSAGLAPEQVSRLIATHEHADHMGAAALLVARYGWPVAAHERARRWLEDAALQKQERPLHDFDSLMAGSVTVQQPLHEGDEVDLGDCRLRVLHTPGHSVGSQSLIVAPDGVVITGDALISAVAAPFYDDPSAVRASVEKLRDVLVPGMRAVSSHAPTPSVVGYQVLGDTLALVDRMDAAVRQAQAELGLGAQDEDALTRRALDLAGWSQQAVSPLTRITVQAVRGHLVA